MTLGEPLRLGIDRVSVDSRIRPPVSVAPGAAGQELAPFQVFGARWLAARDRALLADEPGLGKTVQALRALRGDGAIVACPASLKLVWKEQVATWLPRARVIFAKPGELVAPRAGELVIASLDGLPEVRPSINLRHVTFIIDEAHKLKSADAQRTARAKMIARACGRVWAMTGSPLANTPLDLWGVLQAARLERRAFGSLAKFVAAFGGVETRFGYRWPARPVDLELVARSRDRVMLRRTRALAMPELPGKRIEIIPVAVPRELADQLRAVDPRVLESIAAGELPPFELVSSVRAALAISRVPALLDYVAEHEAAPLVIMSAHVEPLLAFETRPGWAVITGATPARTRKGIVDRFQAGELRGLACSIQVAGVGFTMTRAHHMIIASASYTPADNEQAEDRIARIGSTARSVMITYLVSDHPVDRRLLEIVTNKRAMARSALGDDDQAAAKIDA